MYKLSCTNLSHTLCVQTLETTQKLKKGGGGAVVGWGAWTPASVCSPALRTLEMSDESRVASPPMTANHLV